MASATEKKDSRDPFYLGMALFSLAVVLFGFSRSFFFQDYFEFPAIPVHLTVHGAVLTAWFVLAAILVAAPAATAIIMSTGSWVAFVKWAG